MRKLYFVLAFALCNCVFLTDGFAQSAPTRSSEGWRIRLTPYLWGSSIKGRVGIGNHSADVDASFTDLLKEANFAFMALFEANRNRFTTVTDVVYMNLSDEHATPGPLFSNANAIQKSFLLSPAGGYRIIGTDSSFMEVLGGIRFWHINGELKFEPGILNGIELSESRNWVDGIFALRGKMPLTPTWYLSGYGDIGGGGSNLTYQMVGTAGANLGERYALVFGYRYLNVDYDKDRFLFDTALGGPVFGFTFKF
jgi:hypothetical protein